MEETDVEFDLAEDIEDCVCGVGVVGHGGGVDLVRWDEVVGGRHCVVCWKDVVGLCGDDDRGGIAAEQVDRGKRTG